MNHYWHFQEKCSSWGGCYKQGRSRHSSYPSSQPSRIMSQSHPVLFIWYPRCSEPGWACGKRSRTQTGSLGKFGKQPAFPTAGIPDTIIFYSVPEPRGAQEDSSRVVGARGATSDLPHIWDRDRRWRNQNISCFNSGLISWAKWNWIILGLSPGFFSMGKRKQI